MKPAQSLATACFIASLAIAAMAGFTAIDLTNEYAKCSTKIQEVIDSDISGQQIENALNQECAPLAAKSAFTLKIASSIAE